MARADAASGSAGRAASPASASAAQRLARCMSAWRSSSISTGTCGTCAGALVEAQVHRDRHAAHRPDLQIEHGEIGRAPFDHAG